jgi:hypothetical protein
MSWITLRRRRRRTRLRIGIFWSGGSFRSCRSDSCPLSRNTLYATSPHSSTSPLVANLPLGSRSMSMSVLNSLWNCSLVP